MGHADRQQRAAQERGWSEHSDELRSHPPGEGAPPPPNVRDLVAVLVLGSGQSPYELVKAVTALAELQTPDGQSSVCVELDPVLAGIVRDTWRIGWQPADLVRVVGRVLEPRARPVLVDAIAMAMASFVGTPVHPVWEAQLADLGARQWWATGRSPLHERTTRSSAKRIGLVVEAIHLARFLIFLRPVPELLPPPGSPPTWDAVGRVDERMLGKVRALLAKAESTTFPAEAEALTAKAQEMMARHLIDDAMLQPGSERPGGRRIAVDDPYAQEKALLVDIVAEANGCRSVWGKGFGACTVVGFAAQLELVELLYTSLLVQGTAAMIAAGRDDGGRRLPSFRRSFLTAYAYRLGDRLAEVHERAVGEATTEHGDRLLPVLAERRSAVDERLDELFPTLGTFRSRPSHPIGWAAGREAADRADLGQPRVRDAAPRPLPGSRPPA